MWDIAIYLGVPFLIWQYKMYQKDWGRRKKPGNTLFKRLNPWKMPIELFLLAFPFLGNRSGPRVTHTADREQSLAQYEADRIIEKYKRSGNFGRKK